MGSQVDDGRQRAQAWTMYMTGIRDVDRGRRERAGKVPQSIPKVPSRVLLLELGSIPQ